MKNKFLKRKFWFKSILALCLVCILVLGNASSALAARSGGRIGGGSFRTPRTYSSPRGGYGGGYRSPGYGYGGGGFGFPFLLPFIGFGGGGLFSILIFIAIANFLVRSFSNAGGGESGYASSQVSVAQVQVGLLSNARELQSDLNRLALEADTSSASGRATVAQEASLALLRHPEYWVYGASESQKTNIDAAEAKFNQLALGERSKFSEETLSNVDSVLRQAEDKNLAPSQESSAIQQRSESGEFIIATIIVGVQGNLNLPDVNGSEDLRQALQQIGGVGSDRLLAVEVLWTPQAEGDTLSTNDILAYYPNLKLV
ncbi:DUF1517 domain-containing protein [Myxosarcina sp. GI1]|uniref:DUF1517 domain-containing protein n=1 Tax=Myxosarcina sp. GI1 TaxID=1541065 RepID=UPI00056403BB|nr:DUF1517 domain-containing protein [Myxosarcina sp. GI1]